MKISMYAITVLACVALVSSKAIFKVTLLRYEAKEDKCCDGVNFFGTCTECDPYFTVCLRQSSRGNEKCKDTSRENDKHSVNLAASSIAPTTFNLAIDTLEEPLEINIKTRDYDTVGGDEDMDTLVYTFTPNSTVNHKRINLQGQNKKYKTKIRADISVLCEDDYHGAGCDSYCVNSTSSYCYENGTRVCLEGFTGGNCDIKVQAPVRQNQSAINPDSLNGATETTQTSVDMTTEQATQTPVMTVTTIDQITTDELTIEQSTSPTSTTSNNTTVDRTSTISNMIRSTTDTAMPNNTERNIEITTIGGNHSTTVDYLVTKTFTDSQMATGAKQYTANESTESTLFSTAIPSPTTKFSSTTEQTTYKQIKSTLTTTQADQSSRTEAFTEATTMDTHSLFKTTTVPHKSTSFSSSPSSKVLPDTTIPLIDPATSSNTPVVSPTSACSEKTLADGIDAKCDEFGWDIKVDLDALRCLYPDFDIRGSDIYLGKNLCHGEEDGNMLTFKQGLRDCLTSEIISGSQLIYNNELIYAVPDPEHPFIIRHYNWTVGVECDVYRNESASGHILHDGKGNTTQQVSSQTHYSVDMGFYKDSGYMTEIPGNPLHVQVGTVMYVKVYTPAPGWTIKMVVKNCYTQTSNNATDDTRFYLIQNGCERDTNTHIISQSGHELKFVFEDFQYTTGEDGLYLFCDAVFCSDTDTSTRCQQRCEKTRRHTGVEDESSGYDEETVMKQIIHSY